MLNIKIILGSTRQNRFSDKPAEWILEICKTFPEIEAAETLDLRDYEMPFYDEPVSPSMVKNSEYGNQIVRAWAAKIKEADGYIIICPEYNRGPSGVLKNALDSVYAEWNNKAVGFVAYGSVGGARSVEQLRLTSIELQMAPVRNAVHIFSPWNLLNDKGDLKPNSFDPYKKAAEDLIRQLIWWASSLKQSRG